MDGVELLEALLELAGEFGLDVRIIQPDGSSELEFPLSSGVCSVRGQLRVLLSREDPIDSQCRVIAQALNFKAKNELESRFLAPAVRGVLDNSGYGKDPG
jgi:hypothetical protein